MSISDRKTLSSCEQLTLKFTFKSISSSRFFLETDAMLNALNMIDYLTNLNTPYFTFDISKMSGNNINIIYVTCNVKLKEQIEFSEFSDLSEQIENKFKCNCEIISDC